MTSQAGLFLDMNERDAKDILKNRTEKLRLLAERRVLLEKEYERVDPAVRIGSPGMDGMPGGGIAHDLSDRLINMEKKREKETAELAREIAFISIQEDSIDRVWRCFLALPDPYYAIIQNLYTQGKLYATAQMESGLSHTAFENKRAMGMKLLLKFYKSDYSTNELIRQGRGTLEAYHFSVHARHGKKGADMPEGQMTLVDLEKEIKRGNN